MNRSRWIEVARVEAWTKQGGRCAYCQSPLKRREVTADHVRPRSKGGTDAGNIVAACTYCNKAKGSRTKSQFHKAITNHPERWEDKVIAAIRRINLAADRACRRIRRCVS